LLTPERLYAIAMTPSVAGICVRLSAPPAEVMSADPIGTSLAPNSTVPLMNC